MKSVHSDTDAWHWKWRGDVSKGSFLGFVHWTREGNQSVTSLDLHGSVLFHFPSDRTKTHGFIGGGPRMTYINVDSDFFGGGENTAWGFTVQGGIKVPVRKALALRFGGGYERSFEPDVNIGSVRGGVSFFTGD